MAKVKKHRRPLGRHYIREWRDEKGLTQDQLAERIGLSRTQISRIENHKQGYSQEMLEAIAEALGTTAASLIMRAPGSDIWSLQDALTGMGESQRRQAIAVIEALRAAG